MAVMSLFVRRSSGRQEEARRPDERESFDSGGSEGSQDRVDRDRPRNPSPPRGGRGDAGGASFRDGEHKDKGNRESFRRETVAAKRNRSGAGGLQIVAGLARWWCRVRSASAGLFQKNFEDLAPARVSKSPKRAYQSRRCADGR